MTIRKTKLLSNVPIILIPVNLVPLVHFLQYLHVTVESNTGNFYISIGILYAYFNESIQCMNYFYYFTM